MGPGWMALVCTKHLYPLASCSSFLAGLFVALSVSLSVTHCPSVSQTLLLSHKLSCPKSLFLTPSFKLSQSLSHTPFLSNIHSLFEALSLALCLLYFQCLSRKGGFAGVHSACPASQLAQMHHRPPHPTPSHTHRYTHKLEGISSVL